MKDWEIDAILQKARDLKRQRQELLASVPPSKRRRKSGPPPSCECYKPDCRICQNRLATRKGRAKAKKAAKLVCS